LITNEKNLTNICELRGTHQNSGHPHQNNILTNLLESGLSHQNIESKDEILTMQAKLHYISKNIVGDTFKVAGIKRVGCHLVLNLECSSST
jgi:hypothetical protein